MRESFNFIDRSQGYLVPPTSDKEAALRKTRPWAAYHADDCIVWSPDDEELHQLRIKLLFGALTKAGVQVSLQKDVLGCHKTEFVGHVIGSDTIEPMYSRVAAMEQLRAPTNVSIVRSAVGAFTYCGKFIPHFFLKQSARSLG